MSLFSALYAGTSGLKANSLELAVVGDNIANANTIGFKAGRAAFADSLSESLIGGGGLGSGARLQTVQRLITQGALTSTGMATDLALQGNGMFVVKGAYNGLDGTYYTRAGQFTIDKDGYLVNIEGLRVQAYGADRTGTVNGMLGDLDLSAAVGSANPTGKVTIKANLQADAQIIDPALFPWDPANPTVTSNFSSSLTVFDSLGAAHQVDIAFRLTAPGQWEWHAVTDGGGVAGGTPGVLMELGTGGSLTFDADGKLTDASPTSFTFDPIGATAGQEVNINFGDPLGAGGSGLAGVTQFASSSSTTFVGQDGYGAGNLMNVQIDSRGEVVGAFTNGKTRVLGQIAVASFSAANQVTRIGGNLFTESGTSGLPNIGVASTGGRGAISAGQLEQSNVDLANEFVRMIAAQRGFQANSKTISTADQLLAELMTLKR